MVELQVLSRVIKQGNVSLLTLNGITEEYFITYPEEAKFILDHVSDYGNVPDKETFVSNFPEFSIIDVTESDRYLIDTFNEEYLYSKTVPVINKLAEIIQTDSRAAVEYLQSQLPTLIGQNCVLGVDIISSAETRYQEWVDKKADVSQFFIPTGFEELDLITGGWSRGEELVVVFARTGQGKSWIIIKSIQHAHTIGFRAGLIEPEMSDIKTGYRFDTLNGNISNTAMLRGEEIENYREYIDTLKQDGIPFFVASPKDFKRNITVSKIRSFIIANKLDILAIDGISYLKDERKQRGDNRTTALTNISEDLMDLSIELGVPILIVAQSNREGANTEDGPELENIRDSDGIAYNASTVVSVRQKGPGVELGVKKNRNGVNGDKLLYMWDIDKGLFQYVPSEDGPIDSTEEINQYKSEFKSKDGHEVF